MRIKLHQQRAAEVFVLSIEVDGRTSLSLEVRLKKERCVHPLSNNSQHPVTSCQVAEHHLLFDAAERHQSPFWLTCLQTRITRTPPVFSSTALFTFVRPSACSLSLSPSLITSGSAPRPPPAPLGTPMASQPPDVPLL